MISEVLWNYILNGLIVGSVYAMVAVGLTLIFGILEVINFAHGEFYMLGAYLTWFFTEIIGYYEIAIIIAIIILAMIGVATERITIRPVIDKGWRFPIVSTMGLMIFIQNFVLFIWTATPKMIKTTYVDTYLRFFNIPLTLQHIIVLIMVILVFTSFHLFLMKTKIGKAMRAISQNKEACRVFGVNVPKIYSITFAISGGLSGLAGGIVAPLYVLYPTMGSFIVFKCFATIIMGGLGNIKGAIISAYILGVVESLVGGYISYTWKDMLAFILIIAFLLLRPHGLFGKKAGI
jgi:branched-chain amino acid transport system permease protein